MTSLEPREFVLKVTNPTHLPIKSELLYPIRSDPNTICMLLGFSGGIKMFIRFDWFSRWKQWFSCCVPLLLKLHLACLTDIYLTSSKLSWNVSKGRLNEDCDCCANVFTGIAVWFSSIHVHLKNTVALFFICFNIH